MLRSFVVGASADCRKGKRRHKRFVDNMLSAEARNRGDPRRRSGSTARTSDALRATPPTPDDRRTAARRAPDDTPQCGGQQPAHRGAPGARPAAPAASSCRAWTPARPARSRAEEAQSRRIRGAARRCGQSAAGALSRDDPAPGGALRAPPSIACTAGSSIGIALESQLFSVDSQALPPPDHRPVPRPDRRGRRPANALQSAARPHLRRPASMFEECP